MKHSAAVLRLAVVWMAAVGALSGLCAEGSLIYTAVNNATGGFTWAYITLLVCALLAIDTVVNDLLPDSVSLPQWLWHRGTALCFLGALCVSLTSLLTPISERSFWVSLYFVGTAVFAGAAAVLDSRERYIAPRKPPPKRTESHA